MVTSDFTQNIQRIVDTTSLDELERCVIGIKETRDPTIVPGSTITVGETTITFEDSEKGVALQSAISTRQDYLQLLARIETLELAEGRFIAKISHELRTPLTGIIGLTDLLSATKLDAEQAELCTTIQSCADNLLVVVNDVLNFSRERENIADDAHEQFDVRDVINEVVLLLNVKASARGNGLEWLVHEDVPITVEGVHFRLRQILINLVGNAIKFTENGQISIETTALSDDRTLIKVIDSGIGIHPDKLDDIFKPFVQLSRLSSVSGTGLGLAIVQEQVEKLGGKIWVESVLNEGTTFFLEVVFPRTETPVIEPVRPEILIISDGERSSTRLMSLVVGVPNEIRCLDRPVTEDDLDGNQIIVCDSINRVTIPTLNYLEKRNSNVPVVVLSEDLDSDVPNFCEILKKPVRRSTLLSRLSRLSATWHRRVLISVEDERVREQLVSTVSDGRTRVDFVDSLDGAHDFDQYDWVLGDGVSEVQSEVFPTFLNTQTLELTTIVEIVAAEIAAEIGHVLVTDDDAVNRKVVGAYLESMGVTYAFAFDGYAAYKEATKNHYDIILMDCQMPVMDGFETTRRLRKDGYNGPIIALTSMVFRRERGETVAAGMDDYISKPINRATFERVITTWLPNAERLQNDAIEDSAQALGTDILDANILDQLIADLESVSIVSELSVQWVTQTFEYFQSERTTEEQKRFFHTLKSSAKTLGLLRLGAFAESAENNPNLSPTWKTEFKDLFDLSLGVLRSELLERSD